MNSDKSSIECQKSLSELLRVHVRLGGLFLDHQRTLLRLDLSAAHDALQAYETELLAHMQDEEELMIPLDCERAEAPVGRTAEIILSEQTSCGNLSFFQRRVEEDGNTR